jgi:hypothetical protein
MYALAVRVHAAAVLSAEVRGHTREWLHRTSLTGMYGFAGALFALLGGKALS